jgi:alpha-beta hydrolase superfamily lysophospholipase
MRKVTRTRRALKWLAAFAVVYLVLCAVIGMYLAEVAVKPFRREMPANALAVARTQLQPMGAEITEVSIEGSDRVPLRGWLYTPRRPNGSAVLALHGVSANRRSLIGYAEMMVKAGYTVLTPDARAHGNSGGSIASYGVVERGDIDLWIKWLRTREPGCVHAFGSSMGAAQVLQIVDGPGIASADAVGAASALGGAVEDRSARNILCSAVAEAPFSTFREIAYDRVGQYINVGDWLGRTLMRPAVEVGFITARLRYGVDLDQADPASHLLLTRTPVLLIHGLADTNIPPRHVQFMHAGNPAMLQIWLVNGARHVGAWRKDPQAYESRVLGFFAAHEPHAPAHAATQ